MLILNRNETTCKSVLFWIDVLLGIRRLISLQKVTQKRIMPVSAVPTDYDLFHEWLDNKQLIHESIFITNKAVLYTLQMFLAPNTIQL